MLLHSALRSEQDPKVIIKHRKRKSCQNYIGEITLVQIVSNGLFRRNSGKLWKCDTFPNIDGNYSCIS